MSMAIEWVALFVVVVVFTYICYKMGYRNGERRALRDNRDESHTDFKSRIIGKWKEIQNSRGVSGLITTEFFEDGAVVFNGQMNIANSESIQNVKIEGTWVIENVHMIMTITKSNFPKLMPIGKTFKDEILEITNSSVKYIAENGKIKTHSRA